MTLAHALAAALTALVGAALAVGWLSRGRLAILDHPNHRSLHRHPRPRTGGLGLLAGLASALPWLVLPPGLAGGLLVLLAGGGVIAALSFVDDLRGLPAPVRLAGHLTVTAALVGWGLVPPYAPLPAPGVAWPPALAAPLAVLLWVWWVNLYNFMDGMDGLAGAMAVIGFATYGVLGWLAGATDFAVLAWVIAAAAGGFLVWNLPPARIFLGDTGSTFLGAMAGGLALWADVRGVFPLWMGILVFSPFIADATVTLARRAWRRERVWEAHRSHYYQRLALSGRGPRRTLAGACLLMLGAAGSAVLAASTGPAVQWGILAGWVVLYALIGARLAGVGWAQAATGE